MSWPGPHRVRGQATWLGPTWPDLARPGPTQPCLRSGYDLVQIYIFFIIYNIQFIYFSYFLLGTRHIVVTECDTWLNNNHNRDNCDNCDNHNNHNNHNSDNRNHNGDNYNGGDDDDDDDDKGIRDDGRVFRAQTTRLASFGP